MKRVFFTLLLYVIFGSIIVSAQTETINPTKIKKEYPKHEIGVSYGIFPIQSILYLPYPDCKYNPTYAGYGSFFGSLNLGYNLYFSKLHSLKFDVSWSNYKHNKSNDQEFIYKNDYVNNLYFQVGYGIHYYNSEILSIYSSVYVGLNIYILGNAWYYPDGTNDTYNSYPFRVRILNYIRPAYYINFVGFRIGKQNAANIELGWGTQGGLNLGYSYKF